MKSIGAVIGVLVVGVGLFFLLRPRNNPPENPRVETAPIANSTAKPIQSPATATTALTISTPAPAGIPVVNPASSPVMVATTPGAVQSPTEVLSLPPSTILDNARVVIHNYNSAFGENPVGDNSEITAALMGKNPKQSNFITTESGLRVNAKGELIDAWGTPFFFHQLSGQLMEIRSAGEDRKMWTPDDQVTR